LVSSGGFNIKWFVDGQEQGYAQPLVAEPRRDVGTLGTSYLLTETEELRRTA
jgi:hypothetical protein